jgi:dTDP-4-dehydrorhamnose reductase
MKRLLVTGAGGMVGSEVSERAPRAGWAVYAHSRAMLDIANATAVETAVREGRPDVIINCAAYTAVDRAESEPAQAAAVNTTGARNVAAAAAAAAVPIIHVSTDYVFGGEGRVPFTPDAPTSPLGVYAVTKLAGETAVREESPHHAIIRASWIFSHRGQNFVRTMLRLAAEREELQVVDDQVGRPTSAADLGDALLAVADAVIRDRKSTGTYHFANAGETSWFGFAAAILEELVKRGESRVPRLVPIKTSEYPTAARRPAYSVLNTTTFETRFGIFPRSWRDALRETIDLSVLATPAVQA